MPPARRQQSRERTVTISIEPSAFGPVKAVAAEHVVAHWPSEQGGSPALHGGRRKGHDIVDGGQLIDAKLLVPASAGEKKREGCTHKLRRDLWRPFDPARTTHVMLVEFPPDWTAASSPAFTKTTITIRHENIRLYLVKVDELNELLASRREQAENEKWAFIFLEDDWLDDHRVHPADGPGDGEQDQETGRDGQNIRNDLVQRSLRQMPPPPGRPRPDAAS